MVDDIEGWSYGGLFIDFLFLGGLSRLYELLLFLRYFLAASGFYLCLHVLFVTAPFDLQLGEAVAEDELEILENIRGNLDYFLGVDEVLYGDDFGPHENWSKDDA